MQSDERYQMHCAVCFARFEAATIAESLRKVEEHEKLKHGDEAQLAGRVDATRRS